MVTASNKPALPRVVRCPQCGGDSVWASSNPYRPFCSERCKMIDLGAWANESYRVPVQEDDASSSDPGFKAE